MGILHKKALVTGASSGIGAAVATRLAKNGADIALVGRSAERLHATAGNIAQQADVKTTCHIADLTCEDQVRHMVENAAAELGGLDYLVNCAGVSQRESYHVEEIETAEYQRIMRTNVDSVLFCTRYAMPHLKASTGAHIINILSTAAFSTGAGGGLYSASKYAARALHEAMEAACRGTNVKVSAISPGAVDTNIWSHKAKEVPQARRDGMLRADDIAEIALFLLTVGRNVHIGNITVQPWLK